MFQGLFSTVDLFGTPVIINFSGREKVKTRFGGICSTLFFGFVIFIIYNASHEMFERTNPKSVSSQTYSQNPRQMTLTPDNFPVAFRIWAAGSTGSPFIDESVFTMSLTHYSLKQVKLTNGTTTTVPTVANVTLTKCKLEYFGDLGDVALQNLDLNTMLCIDPNQTQVDSIRLQGSVVSTIYEYMTLSIYECNRTANPTTCADPTEITDLLEGASFNLIYADMVIDPSNYSHPDARYQEAFAKTLSETLTKTEDILLSHLQVQTDSGWATESIRAEDYVKVFRISENTLGRTQGNFESPLLTCTFAVSKLEYLYTRSYKKILTVLAEVASLANTTLVVLILLVNPYLKLRFRETLMNRFFDINLDPQRKHKVKRHRSVNDPAKRDSLNVFKTNESPVTEGQANWNLPTDRKHSNDPLYETKPKIESSEDKETKAKKTHKLKIPRSFNALTDYERTKLESKEKHDKSSSFPKVNSWIDQCEYEADKIATNSQQSSKDMKTKESQFKSVFFSSKKDENVKLAKKELEDDIDNQSPDRSVSLEHTPGFQENKIKILIEEEHSPTHVDKGDNDNNNRSHYQLQFKIENTPKSSFSKRDKSPTTPKRRESTAPNPPQFIKLTIWEYLISFIYKPKSLQDKFELLETGRRNIGQRLDVVNILLKLREIDKMKALLFDKDQIVLYNSLPKPELVLSRRRKDMKKSFSVELLKETKFVDEYQEIDHDLLHEAYENIKHKQLKTGVDEKLLQVFAETLHEMY